SNSKLAELKVLLLLEVGKTYLDLRQTNNSLRYLQAAEILGDAIKVNITGAYNEYEIDHSYARYYDQINEVQKAEQYLLMALEKARKAKDAPLLKKYYKALSLFYDANGDSRQASAYSLDYIGLSDSLALTNNVNAVAQYEMEKKDQEAQLQIEQLEEKRKRGLRNLLFLGLLSLFIAGGLYLRLRLIRESRARIQKEKDRSESLLLNILPYEVAEELKAKGRIAAREFREVSIIFSDFKGFTEAAGQMTAQKLVSEINTCYEAFDHIMDKYKIEKIKTIGDAYMAAGGLSVTFKDSVKHTVLAALEMQRFIIDRKHTVDGGGDDQPTFEMRVGVHTGPIVAGVVGVKKFQYDLWGDTVNIASRMESNGAINQVNVSQNTYELLRGDPVFNFRSRGKVAVKGKGEMEMYFVNLRMTPLLEV
ncbi:MAG: adenylate/guanylate cyclase domain-containing protein, partial [Bacteroidota bacterium]